MNRVRKLSPPVHDLTASEKFWYVVRTVWTSPLSLSLWALGGVAFLYLLAQQGLAAWLPPLAALAIQIALLFRALNNEQYLREIFRKRQERLESLSEEQVESLLEGMDYETRQRVRYVLQLQKELARESRAADVQAYARAELERMAAQVNPVVQRAVRIAQRRQDLAKYLVHVDERALRSYCANLAQRIESTADPVTRSQYEQALKARESELQTYQAIQLAASRIDSQLENVEATLASWKAKVIRIKTAEAAGAVAVNEDLYQELDNLSRDIDLLDSSVTEALAAEDELILRQNT